MFFRMAETPGWHLSWHFLTTVSTHTHSGTFFPPAHTTAHKHPAEVTPGCINKTWLGQRWVINKAVSPKCVPLVKKALQTVSSQQFRAAHATAQLQLFSLVKYKITLEATDYPKTEWDVSMFQHENLWHEFDDKFQGPQLNLFIITKRHYY